MKQEKFTNYARSHKIPDPIDLPDILIYSGTPYAKIVQHFYSVKLWLPMLFTIDSQSSRHPIHLIMNSSNRKIIKT